jgi:hypothetical protein
MVGASFYAWGRAGPRRPGGRLQAEPQKRQHTQHE